MIARGTGYVKGKGAGSRLSAHAKYIEHRSREPGEERADRAIFSKEANEMTRREAVTGIMSRAHTHVAYHKLVLSPGKDEPVGNWQQWTRDTMAELEQSKGMALSWVAVTHRNTENPHVHIVLAGKGQESETGKDKLVRMEAKDYQLLRDAGARHSERDFYREIQAQTHALDRQDRTPKEMEPFMREKEKSIELPGISGLNLMRGQKEDRDFGR
jgi:type IV secretory pathway VirD2 relaxase